MKKTIILVILIFAGFGNSYGDHYPRNPNIDIIHYTFQLTLSDSTNIIKGTASVTVKFLKDDVTGFYLDLIGKKDEDSETGMEVESVLVKNSPLKFEHKKNRLYINTGEAVAAGETRIYVISYSGVPADGLIISKNKFGDRTFFGDNWPDRARNWLPTLDHPYDKASCDFIITAPAKYQVIANGSLIEETDLDNGLRLTHWQQKIPISTELMVIGVTRFAVQHVDKIGCVPVETWVYPKDREKGFYDFAPAPEIIKLYEKLIGPFPYSKLANVESTTRYGGMENASNIFYAEKGVTGKRRNEVTMAHEIAHQWFGDAVTEEDWNHIWLSEGFATFFQHVFVNSKFGEDSLMNVLRQDRKRILAFYRRNPGSPVVDTTITNLMALLNINSYQKGAYVLRMLRYVLGEDNFWKGIQEYYKVYRNKNVLTKDFEAVMEKASGKNLSWFFNEWIYKPGQPEFEGLWHFNKNSKTLLVDLKRVQKEDNIFKSPIDLAIYHGNSKIPEMKRLKIDKRENNFSFRLDEHPDSVSLDPNLWILMKSDFSKK